TKVHVETSENMEILLTKSSINVLHLIGDAFTSALSAHHQKVIAILVNNIVSIKCISSTSERHLNQIHRKPARHSQFTGHCNCAGHGHVEDCARFAEWWSDAVSPH